MFSLNNYAQFQATAHPLLEAINTNHYGNNFQARGNNRQRPLSNFKPALRPFAAAASNWHNTYSQGDATGYGPSSSGYDQQHYAPAISAHSGGGGYGHSSPSGTGYAAPPPPERPSTTFGIGKFKKGGNSAMTALTLLSFFFFVNLLQTCLKEHMNTINPTVMVMTSGIVRNRSNKLAEMNSREHSTSASSTSADGHIVIQPEDLISAAGAVVPATAAPTITIQSPYSSSHLKLQNPYLTASSTMNTLKFGYSNSTLISTSAHDQHRPSYNHQAPTVFSPQQHGNSAAYPWSTTSTHNRFGSTYAAGASNSYYGSNSNYYDRNRDRDRDRDRYGDAYYTRIN